MFTACLLVVHFEWSGKVCFRCYTHRASLAIARADSTLVTKNLLVFFRGIYFALLIRLPEQEPLDRRSWGLCLAREWSMGTFDIVLLATFWYMLKSVPGLMQFVGYFFGFILASWAFDQYFPRD
jgi:hypothetical protein